MSKEETNKLLREIIKDYKEDCVDDLYMHECINRVECALNEGKISNEQYKELVDVIINDFVEKAIKEMRIIVEFTGERLCFKVEKMSNHELRMEIENAVSNLKSIEQNALNGESDWNFKYKSELLRLSLATKELMHRTIKLEEMSIC